MNALERHDLEIAEVRHKLKFAKSENKKKDYKRYLAYLLRQRKIYMRLRYGVNQ